MELEDVPEEMSKIEESFGSQLTVDMNESEKGQLKKRFIANCDDQKKVLA